MWELHFGFFSRVYGDVRSWVGAVLCGVSSYGCGVGLEEWSWNMMDGLGNDEV